MSNAVQVAPADFWHVRSVATRVDGKIVMVQVDEAPILTERGTVHSYKKMFRRHGAVAGVWVPTIREAI